MFRCIKKIQELARAFLRGLATFPAFAPPSSQTCEYWQLVALEGLDHPALLAAEPNLAVYE
jgi:hypothetical protein